jgi:hypothetical protein
MQVVAADQSMKQAASYEAQHFFSKPALPAFQNFPPVVLLHP